MNNNESVVQNEYEQERIRGLHLIVVIVYTIAAAAVIGESFLMGWELFMLPLFVVGLNAAWWLHINQRLNDTARYHIYVILIYIVLFFHGIHSTSLFDVAITTNLSILLFSQLDDERVIKAGVLTYATILVFQYRIAIADGQIASDSLTVSRMALHVVSVLLTSRLALTIINRRKNDREIYSDILKQMTEANVRTENFMANISHELRTPINVVTGITSLLIEETENEKQLDNLNSINLAGRRLFDQIGGILDYTEIDTNRLIISNENYMIPSVINDLINEFSVFGKQRKVELIFDVDAELPRFLVGDVRRIKKILYHLIDNAIKFTNEGCVYIKVYGMKREYGINLCMDVIDTGIGITQEEKSRITKGFYQTDGGRDRKAGGIGLGLPIVYGFVHSMHGFVKIDSEKGKGTKVHVSIPQDIADPSVCISVDDADSLCVACYLRPEKYKYPAVRDFYNEMISNIVKGLKITLHKIAKKDDLDKVVGTYAVTHLFIGEQEYLEDVDYYEKVAKTCKVIVVASDENVILKDTNTSVIRKPFYVLPVAAALNSENVSFKLNDDVAMDNMRPMFEGVKALVVDDEVMNLVVASGIFRKYKMEVDTAESGVRAIAMCDEKDYDIVFMDHMMPEMDGIETMKRIRTQAVTKENVPLIVALTANAVSGAREMFLYEGFDDFVAKPIEIVELLRVLKKLLPQSKIQYLSSDEEKSEEIKPRTEYIDYESALLYCDGDKLLLDKLVNRFFDDKTDNLLRLKELIGKQDETSYGIEIERLKNETCLIGFNSLYKLLDEGNKDLSVINACIDQSFDEYKKLGGALC